MAFRDGRKSWRRLALYISAASIGIAGMVAVGSFRLNLVSAFSQQAKPLLGADVVVRSLRPFSAAADALFASIPYERRREVELNTVAFFPDHDSSRFIELRAIEKNFPFYGEIKTAPPSALAALFDGPALILDETVMTEMGLHAGDPARVGALTFRLAGAVQSIPGEAMAGVLSAPHAFIAMKYLGPTGLVQKESLARHRIYFQARNDRERDDLLSKIEPVADGNSWRITTVEDRKKSLGDRVSDASRFLEWTALIALLLGGIGVASIVFTYARDKRLPSATLRCLGAPAGHTLAIFALQGTLMGAAGTLLGTALGVSLQAALPWAMSRAVAIDIPFFISWPSIGNGAAVGFGVTFLFAILPLLGLRAVPPMEALRVEAGASKSIFKDPLALAALALLIGLIFLYARNVSRSLRGAAAVPAMLIAAFGLLALMTWLSLRLLRRRMPWSWPYAWRHGLANLFRPQNQTYVLVPALGLGAALIFFVSFLNTSLLHHISLSTDENEPTLALVDIQTFQREPLRALLAQARVPLLDETPFVTMRIEAINGRPAAELAHEPGSKRAPWALTHEYKSSYRNTLSLSESLIAGHWPPVASDGTDPVPFSMEEGIAKDLDVHMGDKIVFNVQGLLINSVIIALRRVDWFQLRPNFFAVFPNGVLEDTPQFFIMLTRPASLQASAAIQNELRAQFPNVSAVDLRMIMETLQRYFGKIALGLKAMSFFVVVTGLMILAAALISTRHERLKEAALLRILGASKRDIGRIHLIEYTLIGIFAGVMGVALGALGSFIATKQLFEIPFYASAGWTLAGLFFLVALTVIAGWALGRDVLTRPPLQTIRDEEA
jgi:putative ABC transport system permease protein